jgi:nascent polypeptide-associated complex subunit beta
MSRGKVGSKTGGKGSWRRKDKKVAKGANLEGQKVWAAAARLGCRQFGQLDSASMIVDGLDEAYCFTKPELALDMRANTFVLQGVPVKKPISEVLQELLSGLDLGKAKPGQGAEAKEGEEKSDEGADDLGEIPEDIDFAKEPEAAQTPETPEATETPEAPAAPAEPDNST